MVIQVVEDAAPICLKLSWPQRDAQGAELTLTPTEPALVSELSICDGESRRETIVLKNMSNSEVS